ncbi:MAG: calcium/sodium antiporter [Alphaproteobacteria bacterium]|nr:calcium/sodium antiporter [Alphaproteobacteria bacterium]
MEQYIVAAVGLGLLVLGAEGLVHGAVAIARRLNVSPLLIGVTIVAYGTSTPELIVSTNATLQGSYGIAVGNVVGSNTFNILFILGLTALIAPITVSPRAIGRDALFALVAAGLFIWVSLRMPVMTYYEGALFLAVLLAMIFITYAQEAGREEPAGDGSRFTQRTLTHSPLMDIATIAVGLGLLIVGADMLVNSSIDIARSNGISETMIGLTLVAAGTSLPELATSVVAALRRNPDIALGNITGSNIYNILAILGISSLIGPVQIDPQIAAMDNWVMLAATVALLLPMLFGNRMGRAYGLLLLAGYFAYIGYLFQKAGLLHLPAN